MVSLPLGTSVSSTRPYGLLGRLNLSARRSACFPAVTSFDACVKDKLENDTVDNTEKHYILNHAENLIKTTIRLKNIEPTSTFDPEHEVLTTTAYDFSVL